MQLCDINPFMRYAELQPSVLANIPFCISYDYRIFYVVEGEARFIYNAFEVEELLQKCLAHYRFPTSVSDPITSAIIKELLCYLVEASTSSAPQTHELVQRITVYIQQHYDQEISNLQISNEFGYHSYYLNRIFKKDTGITIHQAVIQEKIRVAKTLLKSTSLSIHSIATESGFSDRSQFCSAFKKHTGYTPMEYRKKKPPLRIKVYKIFIKYESNYVIL